MNPATGSIKWTYEASPRDEFFCPKMGSCQRLPNGNTLITDSYRGAVFEVQSDGDKVWEFRNPVVKDGSRAAIYRMKRIVEPGRYLHLHPLSGLGLESESQ
jgi:outer membrane protein assembly factor BamB